MTNQVDGSWGSWGAWGSCSVNCGPGRRTKERQCDNPAPKNGGKSCDSDGSSDKESENCNSGDCPGI